MAKDLNEVRLEGRAGRDAETRTFQNGGEIVSFSLATERRWQDKQSGEWKGVTTWHNIVVERNVDLLTKAKDIRKGDRVALTGEIKMREYEKEGQKQKAFEIAVSYYGMLDVLTQDKPNQLERREAANARNLAAQAPLDDFDNPF